MAARTATRLLWGQWRCRPQGHLRPGNPGAHVGRGCSSHTHTAGQDQPAKSSAFKPAADSTHDWIGPPNKLSNIRPITYHVPPEETALERRLRMLRQQTETWNHKFWAHQNVTFSKEKEEFISSQLKAKGMAARDEQGRKHTLNSEEMAVFYKSFLDTNRTRHANYNKEWYRRNFTITLLMGRVVLTKAWKTITSVRKTSSSPT